MYTIVDIFHVNRRCVPDLARFYSRHFYIVNSRISILFRSSTSEASINPRISSHVIASVSSACLMHQVAESSMLRMLYMHNKIQRAVQL
jgi:hypothetical protein